MKWLKRLFRRADPILVQPVSPNGYRSLELVRTDDLIQELAYRYQACAFVGQTPTAEHDLQEACYFFGPERIVQGLAMSLAMKCHDNIKLRSYKSNY